ncbi:MAG: ammonium transporter [Alphaproteobacteria bacterium]|jgi:Amt family ammonium transporter|nr:ammonium transporter [Alphaproteobacteria bacterium]
MSQLSRRPGVTPATAATAAIAAAAVLGLAEPALAAEELNSGDTAWMLTSSLLVLLMTVPGVALFYGGMVRKKNVLATIMQSFAVCCMATIIWMVIGYSLAFSGEGPFIGDLNQVFLAGIGVGSMSGTIPESVFMMFQMTFAIITPALITGAVAERVKFSSLMVFLALWLVLVYAPITHWVWGGGGFLGGAGVLDFAGGTVVHINSGVAALVLCLVLGKRVGYGRENLSPHNLTLTMIGASLLWVGWFGFNAGSELAADGNAGMAMAVTQIATAAAALAWMFAEWMTRGKPSVLGIASGAVAGLVAITPASGFVLPGGALVLGLVAGAGCFFAVTWLKHKLGYDDALDVFGVHGIGGAIGAILTGVFAVEAVGGTPGLLEGNSAQIGLQFYGVGVTVAYSAIVTFILAKLVGAVMGLRVEEDEEREGLDISLHGESVA